MKFQKTRSKKIQRISTVLLLSCYMFISFLISSNAQAFSQLAISTEIAPKPQKILRLTEKQRKQKIYDITVMFQHIQPQKLVDYIDFKEFKVFYQKEVQQSNDSDYSHINIECYDTFSRVKNPDSIEINPDVIKIKVPKDYQPLYLDKQVCKKIHHSSYVIN